MLFSFWSSTAVSELMRKMLPSVDLAKTAIKEGKMQTKKGRC